MIVHDPVVLLVEDVHYKEFLKRYEHAHWKPETLAAAYRDALRGDGGEGPWLEAIQARELAMRRALVAEAVRLGRSDRLADRTLALVVERFVRDRPGPKTRDQALRDAGVDRSTGRERSR